MTLRDEVVAQLRAAGCVFAEDEADVLLAEAANDEHLARLVEERVAGRPLEHVVGWAEFCGVRMRVADGVFVPRIRSELLVREATSRVSEGSIVVEPCCGSGAIGAIVARDTRDIAVFATDIDPAAVACAADNLRVLRTGEAMVGDLFAPLPDSLHGLVDLVVANAPYVPTGDIALMPREARLHELSATLDGGADGTDVQRRVLFESREWLRPGGTVLVETSEAQVPITCSHADDAGFDTVVIRDDELDATVVACTYSAAIGVSALRANSLRSAKRASSLGSHSGRS